MVRFSVVSLTADEKTLRQFAAACIVFAGGLGAWKLYHHAPVSGEYAFVLVGIMVGAVGLVAPNRIRLVYAGAMLISFPIGWVVSHFMLAVLFGFVLTPIALLLRALRRDRLRIERPQPNACESYWIAKPELQDSGRYLRQF